MPMFRRKAITVEAVQWDGSNWREVVDLIGDAEVNATPGMWIVKREDGRFYSAPDSAFTSNYEPMPVDEQKPTHTVGPNARSVTINDDGEEDTKYLRVSGGALKVTYKADMTQSFISYSPANLSVELNGHELLCDGLKLSFDTDDIPRAEIKLSLDTVEIDADTMIALDLLAKNMAVKDVS